MKRSILFLLVIASLLLAACGGGTTTTESTSAPAAAVTTEAEVAPEAATDMAMETPEAMETMMPEATEGAMETTAAGSGTTAAIAKVDDCTPKGPQVENLIWWTRAAEGDPDYEHFTAVAQAYTAAGGSPVEVVTVPDAEFRNKVSIAAPAGEGPDVMGPVAHDWVGEFALQEIALEVPRDRLTPDVFLDSALQGATYNGKLYGTPLFVESVALLRNTDLMPNAPATWDEWLTQARELTQGDVAGVHFPVLEQYHQYGILRAYGGYIFKYDNGAYNTDDIGLNNAGSVEGFKLLRDMVHKEPFFPLIERQSQHSEGEGKMEAAQSASTINGPWRIAPLTNASIPIGVSVLPTMPNGEAIQPFLGVQVYVPSAYSKNTEAALDLATFLVCSDSVIEQYKGANKVPARRDVLGEEPIASDQFLPIWLEQASVGEPLPNIPAMANVWKPWGDAADAIITNNAPDDQIQGILDTAVQQIKDEIAKTQQ